MTLKEALRVLTTPSCWIQNYRYSKAWDDKLNRLMDSHRFTDVDEHTANIGGVEVWIENHPYASFNPRNHGPKVRPSRATILKAHDKLLEDLYLPE